MTALGVVDVLSSCKHEVKIKVTECLVVLHLGVVDFRDSIVVQLFLVYILIVIDTE